VRVGNLLLATHLVDKGTPQGSVISQLFSIMIDEVYENVGQNIGRSLFSDDGALWKRDRNVEYVLNGCRKRSKELNSGRWNGNLHFQWKKQIPFSLQERKLEQRSNCIYMVRS